MSATLDRRAIRALDEALRAVHASVRLASAALAEGRDGRGLEPPADPAFERLARLADGSGLDALYLPRIDELRLERDALFLAGEARRAAASARYGTRATPLVDRSHATTIGALADELVDQGADVIDEGPRVDDPRILLAAFARACGVPVEVRFEASLVADAATGERTLFLNPRGFRFREVVRLAVHEVAAHLVAASNARNSPLALLRVGTAGSWEDQEGLALALEAEAGVFDAVRRRRIGARALAALVYVEGGDAADAEALLRARGLTESGIGASVRRAFRAGGSARDLAYVRGLARVRSALADGSATVDALRNGRVSVATLGQLEALRPHGLVRPPVHRPSLAESLFATFSGTSFATSPPRRAASFTRFEDT